MDGTAQRTRSAFVASRSLECHRPLAYVRGCCEPGRLAVRWQCQV